MTDDTLRDLETWIERFSDEYDFARYTSQVFVQKTPTGRIEDIKNLGRLIADDFAEHPGVTRRHAEWVTKERELYHIHNLMLRAGR